MIFVAMTLESVFIDWLKKVVTTSSGLPYVLMGCECEMPSVRHRSSGSDRNATITFHFSTVAFDRFVRLQTCNRYLPGDLKVQSVLVQITVCMCVCRDFIEKLQTLLKPSDPDRSTTIHSQSLTGDAQRWMWPWNLHPIMYLFVHIFCNRSFAYLNVGLCFLKYTWCISESQNKLLIFIFLFV